MPCSLLGDLSCRVTSISPGSGVKTLDILNCRFRCSWEECLKEASRGFRLAVILGWTTTNTEAWHQGQRMENSAEPKNSPPLSRGLEHLGQWVIAFWNDDIELVGWKLLFKIIFDLNKYFMCLCLFEFINYYRPKTVNLQIFCQTQYFAKVF